MRLNLGEDVNQKLFPRFSAPIHDATICGRTEVARLLIERYSTHAMQLADEGNVCL